MCIRRSWNTRLGHMTEHVFNRLLMQLKSLDTIKHVDLTGFGETLVHPKALEYIGRLRRQLPDVYLTFTSNSTLLSPEIASRLLERGLNGLYISLDSLDEKKLSEIRVPFPGEKILSAIKMLSKYKEKEEFFLGISFLAMKSNINELPLLVENAAELGIDKIQVSNLIPYVPGLRTQTLYTTIPGQIIEVLKDIELNELNRMHEYITTRALSIVYSINDRKLEYYMQTYKKLQEIAELKGVSLNIAGYINDIESIKRALYAEKIFKEASKRARAHGIELELPRLWPDKNNIRCPFEEFRGIAVRWDGKIFPCQRLMYDHPEYIGNYKRYVKEYPMGDVRGHTRNIEKMVYDTELKELWRRLGNEFSKHNPWCGECPFAFNNCPFLEDTMSDCLGNTPSCSDCLYAAGIVKCP